MKAGANPSNTCNNCHISRAESKPLAEPTEGKVKEELRGNLCRCSDYLKIVQVILSVKVLKKL
jgi:aerobic-type carbon monoxide dehydrogenase small subunit (CoxS/CutS family)